MNTYRNIKRKRFMNKLTSVVLLAVLCVGALGFGLGGFLGLDAGLSSAEGSQVSVYLFAKVDLKDGSSAYAAEDLKGNKYAVEVVGTGMNFDDGKAAFVKITQRGGKWHVSKRLPAQGL